MKYALPIVALTVCSLALVVPAAWGGPYDSYNGYMSGGSGYPNYFGPGVGYGTPSGAFGDYQNAGDWFRRYIPPNQWGILGAGTGHLGQGYGPYIFAPRDGSQRPSLNDPLPGTFVGPPPPRIKLGGGNINVSLPGNMQGVRQVTVTLVAFNGAELCQMVMQQPPWNVKMPIPDGIKRVRIRVDYCNDSLSTTSYNL